MLFDGCTPEEFFGEALKVAMEKERVSVGGYAQHYLLQLLVRQIDNGFSLDETLGDRFALALKAGSVDRIRILREIGDRALIFSGLWWEHNFRPLRPSHAKFHIDLGAWAYRSVGGVPFDELATNIDGIVGVLMQLGLDHSLTTARDILRLYALWHDTHSRHAARALAAQGLMVMPFRPQIPS